MWSTNLGPDVAQIDLLCRLRNVFEMKTFIFLNVQQHRELISACIAAECTHQRQLKSPPALCPCCQPELFSQPCLSTSGPPRFILAHTGASISNSRLQQEKLPKPVLGFYL